MTSGVTVSIRIPLENRRILIFILKYLPRSRFQERGDQKLCNSTIEILFYLLFHINHILL
jgi:hypothetical protein